MAVRWDRRGWSGRQVRRPETSESQRRPGINAPRDDNDRRADFGAARAGSGVVGVAGEVLGEVLGKAVLVGVGGSALRGSRASNCGLADAIA